MSAVNETTRRSSVTRNPRDISSFRDNPSSCSPFLTASAKPLEDTGSPIGVSYWLYLSIIILFTSVGVSFNRDSCFPSPFTKRNAYGEFKGRNVRSHLQRVTSFGSRPAGSVPNEILAAGYLRVVLQDIAHQANMSGLSALFDEQVSSYSSFQSHFHVSSYNNLRNFVLRLRDPRATNTTSRKAFLVNCHFDTAVGSPGASDAFVNCAVMLEIGRVLAKGNVKLINDIVFLFNGAEESILPGSHAFITQHSSAADVSAFLNLEGAGAGGRLLVFQVGPGEATEMLLEAYSNSFQQPFADVIAEEVFRSGLVPSDTDFRIFRDYGRIPGLDMAFISDGYAYHTPYDTECRISSDCIQNTGEDILTFVSTIAQDKRLASLRKLSPRSQQEILCHSSGASKPLKPPAKISEMHRKRQVYFDVFGLKLFAFDWASWKILNWLLCFCTCLQLFFYRKFCFSKWCALCFSTAVQVLGQIFGFLFILLTGYLIHSYGCRMSWYSTRYNLVGIYVLPLVLWFTWFHTHFFKVISGSLPRYLATFNLFAVSNWAVGGRPKYCAVERDFHDAAVVVLSGLIILLNILNTPAVYVVTLWLFFSSLGRFIHQLFFPTDDSLSLSRIILVLLPILTCVHSRVCMNLLDFIIPIMGRAGHVIIPDMVIAACVFLILSPVFLFLSGSLQCTSVRASKTLRLVLLNACLSYAILVHASPYGFPYTVSPPPNTSDPSVSPRFQRVGIFHTVRSFRDDPNNPRVTSRDSHVLVLPLDVNSVRYLKPNAYPSVIPSSVFTFFHRGGSAAGSSVYGGLEELSSIDATPCNYSRPYCGVAAMYPYLHYFREFFFIPSDLHHSKPTAELHLLSRQIVSLGNAAADRTLWNLTFSVSSGPPHTHISLRTEPPFVQLLRWSFSSECDLPAPVPLSMSVLSDNRQNAGAHYLVYHVNAAAVNQDVWNDPWIFWLVFDTISGTTVSFDISLSGIYMDESVPSSSSPQLLNISSRLPPWTIPMMACTFYDHYRVGFAENSG